MQLPRHLEDHYQYIQDEVKKFNNDYKQHIVDSLPRYVSIPRYIDDNQLDLTYEEQCTLADKATVVSYMRGKPVRKGTSPIGELNCYLEEILDEVFEDMSVEND